MAWQMMPVLFKILDKSASLTAQSTVILETIAALATVSPPSFINSLFKKLLQKLLTATSAADGQGGGGGGGGANQGLIMCELALALVPSLDETATNLLYRAIKPMVTVDDGAWVLFVCLSVFRVFNSP